MAGGPLSIVVSGGSVSGGATMAKEWEAGVGSGLAAASVARTSKTWSPRARSPGE